MSQISQSQISQSWNDGNSVTRVRELEAVRKTLDALSEAIQARRRALAHHAAASSQADADWEAMLRAHREVQLKLETKGGLTGQLIEGLRLDIDVLKHAFRKWMLRTDRNY